MIFKSYLYNNSYITLITPMTRVPFCTHTLSSDSVAHLTQGARFMTTTYFASGFRITPIAGFTALASPSFGVAPKFGKCIYFF